MTQFSLSSGLRLFAGYGWAWERVLLRRAGRILLRKTAQAGEGAAPYLKREQLQKQEQTKHKNKKAETSCSLRMNHII